MRRNRFAPRGLLLALTLILWLESAAAAPAKDKSQTPVVRWSEENSGCTLSRDDDGKSRYGLWADDFGITLAVDSQELTKVHRRHEPFFGVLLTIRYRGTGAVDLGVKDISLEFVKHFRVVESSLDPDAFAEKVQGDADNLNDQAAREIQKHPEKKEQQEAYVRAFLKDSTELTEFVGKNSLRPTRLEPGNREASGWVLFSTESRWIGGWKKQEEFILRVPLQGKIFEFPFRLPPKPGDVVLRRRD
jgi:hypothetical protein